MSDCYEEVRISDTFRFKLYQDTDAYSPEDWDTEDLFLRVDANNSLHGFGEFCTDTVRQPDSFHQFPVFADQSLGEYTTLSLAGGFLEHGSDTRHGYVYVRKNVWDCLEEALKAAQSHLDEWNMYLSGDVWGFEILEDTTCKCCGNTTTEVVNSLWGIYGLEYARKEARETCTTYT